MEANSSKKGETWQNVAPPGPGAGAGARAMPQDIPWFIGGGGLRYFTPQPGQGHLRRLCGVI